MALAVAVAVAVPVGLAAASPSKDLDDARTVFRSGQFDKAIPKLTGLLYPETRLTDQEELVEAHLLLGVAYFETGQKEAAAREIETALALDATLRIDTRTFSDEAVEFFDDKKEKLDHKAREELDRQRRARREQLKERLKRSAFVAEKRGYVYNFIPFGLGQFQNGDRKKAIFFAISEGAMAATSLSLFAYQLVRYPDGRVPADEVDGVRNLQIAQISTGGLFLGLMAWGIIDSLTNYEHTVRRELDPATLDLIDDYLDENPPDESRPPRAAPPDRPFQSSLRLLPTLSPDSVGVGLQWEF